MPHIRSLALNVGPLRHHRDFRLLVTGQLINNLGSQVTRIALPYQLYVLTRSPLALGALAFIQLVAILAFSLLGGAIADAMDRRRLLLWTQAGLFSVSACLAFLALTHSAAIWELYGLAFVAGIFSAVDSPARQSILPRLVTRDRLTAAIAINQAGVQLASIAGPGLGGILIAAAGLPAAYGLDAVTFVASFAALLSIAQIPPTVPGARPSWTAILEGLRFVRRAPFVLAGFVIDIDAMVFGMPVAVFPVLALEFFHAGPTGLGLLVAAPGVGAVIGILSSGWVHNVRFQGRLLIVSVLVWGLSITLFGLTPFLPLALVLLAVAGAADAISAIVRSTINQLTTPDALRGRVSSLFFMVVTSGPRLGDVEATSVAALTTAQISVVSGGVLCLLGLAAIIRAFPQLAAYDAFIATLATADVEVQDELDKPAS